MSTKETYNDVIQTKLDYIQRDIAEIKASLTEEYVIRKEFDPVKKIVYGLVSLILVAVVGSLVTIVVAK